MKKTDGPLTALRPRPITIDQPLPIFWGSKPPDDAIDYEAAPRKTKSKPEISVRSPFVVSPNLHK